MSEMGEMLAEVWKSHQSRNECLVAFPGYSRLKYA